MFIVWGKKLVYRTLGHAADFCPLCRTIRPFELRRVCLAGHVYYITAGEGKLVGHERTCQTCDTAFEADPGRYTAISKRQTPLPELIKTSFPTITQVLGERLALEEKIKSTPMLLSAEERHLLIKSPFLLLSPKVEKRFASTHFDKEVGFAMLGAIALLTAGPALGKAIAPDSAEEAVLVSLALGVVLVGWQMALCGKRFMQRQIMPVLAGALRPLRPTESELKTVLTELKQLGHKVAKKLPITELQAHITHSAQA